MMNLLKNRKIAPIVLGLLASFAIDRLVFEPEALAKPVAPVALASQAPNPVEKSVQAAITARLGQAVDEIRTTPMPGVYEVTSGSEIFYSDATGGFVIAGGNMFETASKANLTAERASQLNKVDYASLPMADSFSIKQGTGARQLVVFADPNCGYCKKLERDLLLLKDSTVHVFLIPILGGDSPQKTRDIWCSADKGQVWRDWMVGGHQAPQANCDTSAIQRNLAFATKYRVTATPTMFYEDGTRMPGALPLSEIEKKLAKQVQEKKS